jgi:hypothetical protein
MTVRQVHHFRGGGAFVDRHVLGKDGAHFYTEIKRDVQVAGLARSSASKLRNALGPPEEVVNKSSEPVGEDDDEDPNDLVVSLSRLFCRTLYEHPNPENCAGDSDQQNYKQFKDTEASSEHSQPLGSCGAVCN